MKRHPAVVVFVVLAAVVLLAAQRSGRSKEEQVEALFYERLLPTTGVRVAGTVVDEDGKVLSGVRVSARVPAAGSLSFRSFTEPVKSDVLAEVVTDATGRFELKLDEVSTLHLKFEKEGHYPAGRDYSAMSLSKTAREQGLDMKDIRVILPVLPRPVNVVKEGGRGWFDPGESRDCWVLTRTWKPYPSPNCSAPEGECLLELTPSLSGQDFALHEYHLTDSKTPVLAAATVTVRVEGPEECGLQLVEELRDDYPHEYQRLVAPEGGYKRRLVVGPASGNGGLFYYRTAASRYGRGSIGPADLQPDGRLRYTATFRTQPDGHRSLSTRHQ
ncbi:MAG: carboxypeptidase-like regulatory domain-containing protein [Acidobacteriota bacterium]